MTAKRSTWLVTSAVAIVAATTSRALAQQPTEARIQELLRQAAERVATQQSAPPGLAQGDSRPVVQVTLEDAVKFALDHNLDIAVQRLNPAIQDISLASLRATYHTALTSNVSQASLAQLPTSQLIGGPTCPRRR